MKNVLTIILLMVTTVTTYAYDFSEVCSTGQTLYYNILSDSTVEVTHKGCRVFVWKYGPFDFDHYDTIYYDNGSYGRGLSYGPPVIIEDKPTGVIVIPAIVNGYLVTSIGAHAFHECNNITKVVIPNGVNNISNKAYYGCSGIDSLYIGSGVVSIGSEAFRGCTALSYMYYNARNLGTCHFMGNAFYRTSTPNFTTLIIGDSVRSIPSYCFYGRSSIHSLIIPDYVTSIGEYAFNGCSGTDSLYIGSGVDTIGQGAFSGCTNLKYLFYNAKNLSTGYFMDNSYSNPTPYFTKLIIGDSVNTIPNGFFYGRNCINSIVVIPDGVTSIGENAFSGCSGIDSLYIGNGVISIGDSAFVGCMGIHHIILENVDQIGGSAFSGCGNITTVRVPNNTIVELNAFYGCTSLLEFSGGDSIGRNAFVGCNNLSFLHTNAHYIGDSAFIDCDSLSSITIYARHIGQSAFSDCDRLSQVMFGDSLQVIGNSAFANCDSLTLISPINAKTIGQLAFANCNRLTQVILGDSVQNIGNNAFINCDNILSINTNAKTIGNSAFANCDRLVSVTLGDSVQALGNRAFSGCFRINNVSLGEGITSIGNSAFSGCIRLTNPELPNSLATIGARAFDGCGDINGKLTFPASITHIGDSAYNGVGNITEIEMKGSTPPTIHAHTFAAVDSLVTVSVPCGAVLNYYITDYWENFPNIVEAPPYRLTVQSNNEVMGSATVTRQTTCSNHTATIYAVAQTGYHFLQWNDGITANPRSIPMTQDSAFTAIFVVNNSYITVHANDSTMGSVSGTGLYGYNAPVTLTATPYSGYHFLRWSDGNTQNPRYLAAVRDSSFTAIFVSNVSTITVANANPDMGNVSGSGVYYYQNLVSLTATANYGYHFVQWNDGNILVSQDSAFTAYFALNTYSIVATSNSTTMGSVSGGGQYTYLHEMSMTATPAYGYHFVQWNDGVTDNPRTITVTRDSAFTAHFAANSYTLTVAPNDATMGSAYGAGSYNYNTTATLTAVPNYGYHFTQWSDAVTDNPRTVTVLNNATYTAQFEINSYIITVQSSNPAIGTTSGSGSYNYLTPVNITALPNAGYHFTQWSDGNTTNPRLISVTANATYTAQFAINSYAVGVTSNNSTMGSVSGSGTYNHNSTATLTATPYYGYHFVQWQDGNTQNPRTVVVTDSAQYTAQFDYNSYLVTALSSNVTLGTATGGGSYNYLSQVALTAVPAPHYHFTMWNDSIEDNPRTITVTRDTTLTAHFSIDRHTIGVNTANATQGTATGSSTVDYNTVVWISATPNYGYHFTQWNDGNSSNPRRVVVSQDTVFTASFAPNQYIATCMANDNSRGSVTSAGGSYNYLTSVTFTAVPNANYHFLRWSNGSTDNPITFTLTQDTALTAIFVGLTANVDDNTMGTATHTKTANLVEVVTATPNYGYHFVQWQDGNTDNPRTVTLTQDTVLTAYFAVNSYHVTLGSNDSTLGSVQGGGDYDYLSPVTISATAAQHCHFVQWSDGNTTNPRLLTLTCDTMFTALFERDQQYQIVVTANDSTRGSVAGGGQYYLGEAVAIAATANEHYYFEQWSDGVTSNPRVVTVTGDATYTAVFEPVMYTLTVAANDYSMGQVAGSGSYAYGSTVTIEARAFGGYRFVGWDDGVQDEQRTVTVTADATYTALFEANVGIEDVEGETYRVYVQHGHIVVKGIETKRVQIYDLTGRRHSTAEQLPTGVYVVRIDNRITKRVVVM